MNVEKQIDEVMEFVSVIEESDTDRKTFLRAALRLNLRALLSSAQSAEQAATQPSADGVDAREIAFEAVRKAFCKLQRYSFFLDSRGNVRRCADHCGNWVEFDQVHTMFEPQFVDAALAAQAKQGGADHG